MKNKEKKTTKTNLKIICKTQICVFPLIFIFLFLCRRRKGKGDRNEDRKRDNTFEKDQRKREIKEGMGRGKENLKGSRDKE